MQKEAARLKEENEILSRITLQAITTILSIAQVLPKQNCKLLMALHLLRILNSTYLD